MHYKPNTMPHASNVTATSSSTCSSSTTVSPALPHSKTPATARKQQDTSPEPLEQPQPQPHLSSLAHTSQKYVISPLPVSHTLSAPPMMPFMHVNTPCPPLVPLSPPICPSSPQLDPKQAVSPPPTCFD
jgi:hypothetical protein